MHYQYYHTFLKNKKLHIPQQGFGQTAFFIGGKGGWGRAAIATGTNGFVVYFSAIICQLFPAIVEVGWTNWTPAPVVPAVKVQTIIRERICLAITSRVIHSIKCSSLRLTLSSIHIINLQSMSHWNTVEGLVISFRDCPFEFWAKHSCNDDNDARFRSYSKPYQFINQQLHFEPIQRFTMCLNLAESPETGPGLHAFALLLAWMPDGSKRRRSLIAKSECKLAKSRKVSQLFKNVP